MSDRELSTRDLAERPENASPADQEEAPNQEVRELSGDAGELSETEPADEPLTRGRSESEDQTPTDDSTAQEQGPLLSDDQTQGFIKRWREIQVGFVDEPRDSVAQADTLVADLMQQLAASFSDERERLERQWDSGADVSTEDLRIALTRYRSFFDRLLSA